MSVQDKCGRSMVARQSEAILPRLEFAWGVRRTSDYRRFIEECRTAVLAAIATKASPIPIIMSVEPPSGTWAVTGVNVNAKFVATDPDTWKFWSAWNEVSQYDT